MQQLYSGSTSTEGRPDFGCRISAGGHVSMWSDYVRIMAAGQAADELEQTKQSIKAKATAAVRGRGELHECRT